MSEITLDIEELMRLLGDQDLTDNVAKVFHSQGPLIYRNLSSNEQSTVISEIYTRIDDISTDKAGPDFKSNWEANWSENLDRFNLDKSESSLIPKFISSVEPIRLNGRFVMPLIPEFEIKIVRILRAYLFEKYFSEVNEVHEFGAGTGFNLIQLGQMYPSKELYGYDWSNSSVKLMTAAGAANNLNLIGRDFDMFAPNYNVEIGQNSGLITVGALEQLGSNWSNFLDFSIKKKFSIFINIETNYEMTLFDNSDIGVVSRRYIERRNWLMGYFAKLENLQTENRIEILSRQKVLGSRFHDSWTFTVWRLTNV